MGFGQLILITRRLSFSLGMTQLRSLLRVAWEISYIDESTYSYLRDMVIEVSRSLANQIKALKDTVQ